MSRKQAGKPVRGNRKCDVERKRDERAARRALAKERKNRPPGEDEGEEFVSFSNQLQALGLKLREIPGDGNCLFRALADQLEGHSRSHLRLRQETVQYMSSHRQDFEPFVEDDVPFAQHLANLSQPGTFAGNDAIVAFARSRLVRVVIHQLNMPLWEINGSDKQVCPELHIAYRYGDHYDSVRHNSDNSERPTHLRVESLNICQKQQDFNDKCRSQHRDPSPTPSEDEAVILSCLLSDSAEAENLCQSSALDQECHSEWTEPDTGRQPCSGTMAYSDRLTGCGDCAPPPPEGNTSQKSKISNKQRKEQQRLEKKKRQEERHRQKVLQSKASHDQNQNLSEPLTLVPALNTLSI
ncbi:OTU domain-containing protein 3 [Denticeps clupeoides]|nr:OTU domain-containing protein 3 [Denticeps clupeoides]